MHLLIMRYIFKYQAMSLSLCLLIWLLVGAPASAYVTGTGASFARILNDATPMRMAKPNEEVSVATQATLTAETTWQLRIVLRNIDTVKGKRMDNVMFVVTGQFVEEEGYEPPQGFFQQQSMGHSSTITGSSVDDANTSNEDATTGGSSQLKIVRSRWILSEDPTDRKDGLWVWGLFKEPLYPFMLLQLETDVIALANDDSIAPLQLYAQVNHKRVEKTAVLDSNTDLKIRQQETIKADPFGVSQVDVYEEVSIGSLSFQPLVTSSL